MSSWGKCDFSQFRELAARMERLSKTDISKLYEKCAKALAARLLSLVIPKTPVGDYPASSGKKGGTLRRGWTAATQAEAAGGQGGVKRPDTWAASLPVWKNGDVYEIAIVNPIEYASYVEFGHRKPGGGFVAGRRMLTVSEQLLKTKSGAVIEKEVQKFLEDTFNV